MTKNQAKEPDPRHAIIRAQIVVTYRNHNDGREPPWSGRHGKTLDRLLKSLPSWPVQDFVWCVVNRFSSEVNKAEDPVLWIQHLPNYISGPLDRYGKPLKDAYGGFFNDQG